MREALRAETTRILHAHPFTLHHTGTEGVRVVYIAISDASGLLANINVTRTELLAALGVEG